MRLHGDIAPARVAALAGWAEHAITEEVVRAAIAAGASVDVVQMDEFTLDLLVALDDVTLVYDTT